MEALRGSWRHPMASRSHGVGDFRRKGLHGAANSKQTRTLKATHLDLKSLELAQRVAQMHSSIYSHP